MGKLYKFMNDGLKSVHGQTKWKVGMWFKVKGVIDIYSNGFHASKEPLDALSYVNGSIIAIVEGRGATDSLADNTAFREMRIVKAYNWTKADSVALAIYSAKLCIEIYEKQYPNDSRPRDAIEAAEKWLKNPTQKNQDAAGGAARVADAAADAAGAAARVAAGAAMAAAGAAMSSACAAAWAADAAAWAADAVARAAMAAMAAGESSALKKINEWMKQRINKLSLYEVDTK